jgi:hypothetical protein
MIDFRNDENHVIMTRQRVSDFSSGYEEIWMSIAHTHENVATNTPSATGDPKFSLETWQILSQFERRLSRRILDLLEERMVEEERESITGDDVRACIKGALEEFAKKL